MRYLLFVTLFSVLPFSSFAQEYDGPLSTMEDAWGLKSFGIAPRSDTPPAFTINPDRCDPNLAMHLVKKWGYSTVRIAHIRDGKVVVYGSRNGKTSHFGFADEPGCPETSWR
jgi:hypothetical protein